MNILKHIKSSTKPLFAVLIDPENSTPQYLEHILQNQHLVDMLMVGGSLVSQNINKLVKYLKTKSQLPVVLFPGSVIQVSTYADAILFLSLISGRNPEYLISQHVQSAMILKKSQLQVIPTGYILIDTGKTSTTQYITNTTAIPSDKLDIIVATAVAGQLLGMKSIYLEGGSGADNTISSEIINQVKKQTKLPVFVGGGISTPHKAANIAKSGADVVVVGNAIEKNPKLLAEFSNAINSKE